MVTFATVVTARFLTPPSESLTPGEEQTADAKIAELKAQIASASSQVDALRLTLKEEDADVADGKVTESVPRESVAAKEKVLTAKLPNSVAQLVKGALSNGTTDEVIAQFQASLAASEQKSLIANEEFVLGLLLMHQSKGDWTEKDALAAMFKLSSESPLVASLYKHHTEDKPLATQLAQMMDEERKNMHILTVAPLDLD